MGDSFNINNNHQSSWYDLSNSGDIQITDSKGDYKFVTEDIPFFSKYNPIAWLLSLGGFVEKQTFDNRTVYLWPKDSERITNIRNTYLR